MNSAPDERGKRLIDVFNEAKALPNGDQREQFLDEACGQDKQFRAELNSLLRAGNSAGDYLQGGPAVSSQLEAEFAKLKPEEAGDQIGPYKLREQIGEGGFGTVWVAEQEVPVRRRVAMKILKIGMDTREVIARFEQERQALAIMDHPSIARVIDAGATKFGRPFFVMELVRGVKITDYCDAHQLSTEERIGLFIKICHAVQHAHQKGIIHRDLKPSNILVTVNDGKPVPKVIDFGVAKAMAGRLSEHTVYTQFQQMIGTPLYMSPEQAELTSVDIDTRSDIYSLGVLLYELLTGRTPFEADELMRVGVDEMRRVIREEEPKKPSTALSTMVAARRSTVAQHRDCDAAKLISAVQGDLDWIVMKCLEKDRKRRYETATGLAADLQRHLRNEVVIARPPTTAYLLGKLIKRNKLAFAAAAAVGISLLIGVGTTAWQLVQTRKAEQRVTATLDELRKTAPAFAEQARALAARERYDEAIQKLEYASELRPDAAEYLVAKADLLQCQVTRAKLSEAAAVYRQALRVQPGLARAEASAKLCDELLAAEPAENGKLTREGLAKLHLAMQQQQRPAVELMPVARLLGDEKKLLVDYWAARLKDLPVAGEKPLEKRLTVQDDGRLAFDLSWTKVVDLSPLTGAPLAVLNLTGCAELKDISPLRESQLVALYLGATTVADLTPLGEMRSLEKLNISDTQVTDLSPIKALRLKTLSAARCAISELAPIRGMPLEELTLFETRVADITPLSGMPIKDLDLSMCPVLDFAPLATLPLEKCYLQQNRITDLSVFRGKPLKELVLLGCGDARNFPVLTEIPTLELLLLPTEYRRLPWEDYRAIGALRKHPKLRQIGAEVMGGMHYSATGPKDVFWQDWDREQSFVLSLRERNITFGLRKLATGTYSLGMENQTALTDLSVIKGAPISVLNIPRCNFTDLTPLRGMPLRILQMSENDVRDLSPLQGMPLEDLYLRQTKVTDLTPLAGMPLKRLFLDGCTGVSDVKVLGTIKSLQHLTIPPGAANIESLRSLPNLRKLAYHVEAAAYQPSTTVEQFWREHDEQNWLKQLRASGSPPEYVQRHADATWEVRLNETGIVDLQILSAAPISRLWLRKTGVTDLAPLRGMSLKELRVDDTKITDLRPLAGMPLETLDLSRTKVTDISALRGMPLKSLRLHGCEELTDLAPIAEAKSLTSITLPPKAVEVEFLRAFPKLQRIGFAESSYGNPDQTAIGFWKEYDSADWLRKLQAAGFKPKQAKRLADGTWDLNFQGTAIADLEVLRGAPISSLYLRGTAVSDLSALRELPLTSLSLFQTGAADLRPLQNMSLRYLDIRSTNVADLAPLRSPPLRDALKDLRMYKLKVTDFSPIADLKNLEVLDVSACAIDSLEIVRGRKLRYLHIMNTNVRDLSILAGMPLEELQLNDTPVTDLRPLLKCTTLRRLVLPAGAENVEALRALPGLVAISYECQNDGTPKHTAAEFWTTFDERGWIRVLEKNGIKPGALSRLRAGAWDVDFHGMKNIASLEMLKGAPITVLRLGNTAISDLAPLRGMPLERLLIYGTKVSDLSPLKGMQLTYFHAAGAPISDISALRGMPLKEVKLHGCPKLTDLSPLAESRDLTHLTIPPNAKNFEFLRALPKLERLSYRETTSKGGPPSKTAEEFWKEYGAK